MLDPRSVLCPRSTNRAQPVLPKVSTYKCGTIGFVIGDDGSLTGKFAEGYEAESKVKTIAGKLISSDEGVFSQAVYQITSVDNQKQTGELVLVTEPKSCGRGSCRGPVSGTETSAQLTIGNSNVYGFCTIQ